MDTQQMIFQPVEKDLLYLKIADIIFVYIQQNDLKGGDKLPSERDMANMFHTGRNSVREALRVLVDRGILDVKPGRGTFVKEQENTATIFSFNMKDCKFDELLELKCTIERRAIKDAIENGTQEEKAELLRIGIDMRDMAEKGMYSNTQDHQFHRLILKMSRNRIFYNIAMTIREKNMIRNWDAKEVEPTTWIESAPQHYDLALAISDGNVEKALEVMDCIDNHVAQVEKSCENESEMLKNA